MEMRQERTEVHDLCCLEDIPTESGYFDETIYSRDTGSRNDMTCRWNEQDYLSRHQTFPSRIGSDGRVGHT